MDRWMVVGWMFFGVWMGEGTYAWGGGFGFGFGRGVGSGGWT